MLYAMGQCLSLRRPGWDQQMSYTWFSDRWVLPAVYYKTSMVYKDCKGMSWNASYCHHGCQRIARCLFVLWNAAHGRCVCKGNPIYISAVHIQHTNEDIHAQTHRFVDNILTHTHVNAHTHTFGSARIRTYQDLGSLVLASNFRFA